jgi:hypothetical protein
VVQQVSNWPKQHKNTWIFLTTLCESIGTEGRNDQGSTKALVEGTMEVKL